MSKLLHGEVIASHGRHYMVQQDDGAIRTCVPRGKRSDIACGDRVAFAATSEGEGVIEALDPRSSLFYRSVAHRAKLIGANLTQIVYVVATEPNWSDEIVCRVIAAAEQQRMRSLIVLNKSDLPGTAPARDRLAPFAKAGYRVLEMAAKRDVAPLRECLLGQRSALVGQSGMGKSTIINSLFPEALAPTGEISRFLDSGRHTTSASRLYRLDASSIVVDSPGLQEFGLAHLSRQDIEYGFVEIRPYLGGCRFNDCRHQVEPGCAVQAALAAGAIHPRRYELLMRILSTVQ